MKMYQLSVEETVRELRERLQQMVNQGYLEQDVMIRVVKQFAEEKSNLGEGQQYVIICA